MESEEVPMNFAVSDQTLKLALSIMKAVRALPHGYRIIFPDDFFEKDLQQLDTWREHFRLPRSEDEVTREQVVDAFWAAEQNGGFIPHLRLKQAFILGKPSGLIPAFRKKARMVVDPTWARSAKETNLRLTMSPKWDRLSCAFDSVLALVNRMNLRILNFDQMPPCNKVSGAKPASASDEEAKLENAYQKLDFVVQTWCTSHLEHHTSDKCLDVELVISKLRDRFRELAFEIRNFDQEPKNHRAPGMEGFPVDALELATKNVPQVTLHTAKVTVCTKCHHIQPQRGVKSGVLNLLELGFSASLAGHAIDMTSRPLDGEGCTFLQSLHAFWSRRQVRGEQLICTHCKKGTCALVNAVQGALPPRLVLSWPKLNGGGITEYRELENWADVPIPHWVVTDCEGNRGFSVHQVVEHYRVAGIIFTTGGHFMTAWRERDDQWAYYDGYGESRGAAQPMTLKQVRNIREGSDAERGTAVVVLENTELFE